MDVLQHAHVQRWVSHESTGSMLKADNTTGYFGVHHHPATITAKAKALS